MTIFARLLQSLRPATPAGPTPGPTLPIYLPAEQQRPGNRPDARPDGRSGDSSNDRNSKPSGPGGSGGGPGAPRTPRGIFLVLSLISLVLLSVFVFQLASDPGHSISWKEFEARYNGGLIKQDSVRWRSSRIVGTTNESAGPSAAKTVYFQVPAGAENQYAEELQLLTGGNFQTDPPPGMFVQLMWAILPLLLIVMLIYFLISRSLRGAGGGPGGMLGSFGKSKHRMLMKEKTGVTFNDVAGINEAKSEVEEIIQFLKSPKRFTKLGGRIPRGVLLIGDPGCGKTLLAKAIAGEADVPFFSISGSDFVEMFVGVGASRVRDLFKQAKENAPCIIFLDEIDAVGRRRGGGFNTGGHDEREQTLNAILVEMDGFTTTDGIIVVAATNRADVLDPALTRPGRFDRSITVPLPDVKGRLEILRVHAKNKRLSPNVDMERLAKATPMFSGADLAAIMNEAAISATLLDKDFIEQEDLEEARDKVRFGRAKKSRVREADENKLVAYHEAGHAILQVLLKDADPLHKVTIIPRGSFGGATFSLPEKDRHGYGLKYLTASMRVACGGRIAEQRAMNDISSGASGDITQVTAMARAMVEEWGMSDKLGFIRYSGVDSRQMYQADKAYGDQTANIIDDEIKRLVSEAYADADRLLNENWDKVEAVAQALLKYETLDAADVHRIMRGEQLTKPTISDLLAQEARKNPPASPPAAGPSSEPQLPPGTLPTPA